MNFERGMSLIELMVTVLIFAVIASAGVPAMQSLFERKSIDSISRSFNQSMQLARSEAIQRSAIVRVQPISNGNNWANGWELEFTNSDGNDEVIRSFPLSTTSSPNLVFESDDFSKALPIEILANGQANTIGDLNLYNTGTGTNKGLKFELQLSGLIKKSQTTGH